MSRIQVGELYGILGTDYPARVIPFAARFDDRGRPREVNAVHEAMVNTEGAGGVHSLLHVDCQLGSTLQSFGINFYSELRAYLVAERAIQAALPE